MFETARKRGRLFGLLLTVVCTSVAGGVRAANAGDEVPLCRPWSQSACLLILKGSLRSASSGAPLAGKLLRFVAHDVPLCEAITDASGRGVCEAILGGGPVAWYPFRWRVVFDGDGIFDPGASMEQSISRQTTDRVN